MRFLTVALSAAVAYAALLVLSLTRQMADTEHQNDLLWEFLLACPDDLPDFSGTADAVLARIRADQT